MRLMLAALPLVLLAACDRGAEDNATGNIAAGEANTAAANAVGDKPMATGNAAAPATGADADKPAGAAADPLADARRADMIRECSDDVRSEVPAGTDLAAFCGCAVDRMQGGRGEREAMESCAAEMGIQPNRP